MDKDDETTAINVEYNEKLYEISNLSKEFAEYLSQAENNDYLKTYMEQAVLKTSSEIEDSSDVGARKGVSKTGQPKTTPKGKRKYTSYRKLEDESDQNTFDEALVSLVMDKPELYNMKLDTSKKTREKVALAWIDIQESLKAEYTIDELKGRWTSLKSGYVQRKKKKKSGDGASFDPITSKLDTLMAGLCDLTQVRETQSNLPKRNASTSNCNSITSIERDMIEGDYLNSFFNDTDERAEEQPIPPESFKKKSKTNEIGEKFLKCFTELKNDFFNARHQAPEKLSVNTNVYNVDPNIEHFCSYIATCLQGFSDIELEEVQFGIMSVIVEKKREFRS